MGSSEGGNSGGDGGKGTSPDDALAMRMYMCVCIVVIDTAASGRLAHHFYKTAGQ